MFISRLINWLRGLDRVSRHRIPLEAHKDLSWWRRFLPTYNGVSILWLTSFPEADTIMAMDACQEGYGGTLGNQFFRGKFPKAYKEYNIALLELKAVLVALRIWAPTLAGKYFWVNVDNQAVAIILNTGKSRDPMLQDTLGEVALVAAKHQFVIRAKHIAGVENRVPDWLSRWHQQEARKQFRIHSQDQGLTRVRVTTQMLHNSHNW